MRLRFSYRRISCVKFLKCSFLIAGCWFVYCVFDIMRDDGGNPGADRGIGEADSPRVRTRSVINTKLYRVGPKSVSSTRRSNAKEDDGGNPGADRGIVEADSPRVRTRSVIKTKLYGVGPKSVSSTRRSSAKEEDVSVLSFPSIEILSCFVNPQTVQQIGLKLGVSKFLLNDAKNSVIDEVNGLHHPIMFQNFWILWAWRGEKVTKKKVDQLLNVLRGINEWELAVIVSDAHKENRGIRVDDFKSTSSGYCIF